jgi:hypothetical protein
MSIILDALRRGRSAPPPGRILMRHRQDAVLQTLGYGRFNPTAPLNRLKRVLVLLALGVADGGALWVGVIWLTHGTSRGRKLRLRRRRHHAGQSLRHRLPPGAQATRSAAPAPAPCLRRRRSTRTRTLLRPDPPHRTVRSSAHLRRRRPHATIQGSPGHDGSSAAPPAPRRTRLKRDVDNRGRERSDSDGR